MHRRFIGRRAELSALERHYATKRSAMVPVYGRRRVGKTELLLRFITGKPAVYFSATQKLRGPQIADLMRAAAAALSRPELADAVPVTWEAALRLVVAAAPEGRKLVLVIDEFQWLCESSPDLPSVLQRLWDLEWHRGWKSAASRKSNGSIRRSAVRRPWSGERAPSTSRSMKPMTEPHSTSMTWWPRWIAQELLGHASVVTTMRCAHVAPHVAGDAVWVLDSPRDLLSAAWVQTPRSRAG